MDKLQLREEEVFKTLKGLKELRFVVIGGYAVNAYALPRFSVDCDIVIEDNSDLERFDKSLVGLGYKKTEATKAAGNFARYEKKLDSSFKVSFDILIGEVFDRQTKVSIPASWIFKNSEVVVLKGKTIVEELKARIIKADALFVMKMVSCRSTDIRDIFMLALAIKDRDWVRKEISSLYDFDNRFEKVKAKIKSRKFKDDLQGVYGLVDSQIFERSINAVLSLKD
jgi:hypothetical protein